MQRYGFLGERAQAIHQRQRFVEHLPCTACTSSKGGAERAQVSRTIMSGRTEEAAVAIPVLGRLGMYD